MARRLHPGDPAPPLELPAAGGGHYSLREALGTRVLLSFHRYAT